MLATNLCYQLEMSGLPQDLEQRLATAPPCMSQDAFVQWFCMSFSSPNSLSVVTEQVNVTTHEVGLSEPEPEPKPSDDWRTKLSGYMAWFGAGPVFVGGNYLDILMQRALPIIYSICLISAMVVIGGKAQDYPDGVYTPSVDCAKEHTLASYLDEL